MDETVLLWSWKNCFMKQLFHREQFYCEAGTIVSPWTILLWSWNNCSIKNVPTLQWSGFIVSFLLSGWFSSVTFSLLSDYHHSLSDRIAGWLSTDMDNQVPVLDFFCTWFLGLQLLKFWTKLVSSNLFLLLSWSCSLKLLDQQNCFLTCKVVLANYACYYYLIGQ